MSSLASTRPPFGDVVLVRDHGLTIVLELHPHLARLLQYDTGIPAIITGQPDLHALTFLHFHYRRMVMEVASVPVDSTWSMQIGNREPAGTAVKVTLTAVLAAIRTVTSPAPPT